MTTSAAAASIRPWLLLIHQIPPKPDYLRVKVGRRLQRIGAVAIKNSVYVLPATEQAAEDFEWVLRDIAEAGGEAFICRAELVDGLTDDEIERLFVEARARDYEQIANAAEAMLAGLPARHRVSGDRRREIESGLVKLEHRFAAAAKIDFFGGRAPNDARAAIARVEERIRPVAVSAPAEGAAAPHPRGRTWVTRAGVFVDRIASAWLIRRFIDPDARFKFVAAQQQQRYRPGPGEIRFDMFDAEYTHEGDRCTFETLLRRFDLAEAALIQIAQIVHDIDLKDDKFARADAAGIERVLAGIAAAHTDDRARLERGAQLFDEQYALFTAEQARI